MNREKKERNRKLFGTDGIRGRSGEFPLDPDTMMRLGEAVVGILDKGPDSTRILIGRDTRESGPELESALCQGVTRAGGLPVLGGILPTPAIAHLTVTGRFDAGIVISASHNPYPDNGIKVFSGNGHKLADSLEAEIEHRLQNPPGETQRTITRTGKTEAGAMEQEYIAHLRGVASDRLSFRSLRIALDCANGAACRVAPALFRSLGTEVHVIGVEPSGRNINEDCGSLFPGKLASLTRQVHADLGVAFDGDADRAVVVDRTGRVLDGDHLLYLSALAWRRRDLLKGNGVVSTVMANQWLEKELSRERIQLHRTPVGDKFVLKEMLSRGCNLGGEPSGHLIYLDHGPTGDGILTTLMLLEALQVLGWDLGEWAGTVRKFPQKIVNVPVAQKPALGEHPAIAASIRREETRLGNAGRLLVRYSGTEPLVRIMVEAENPDLVEEICRDLSTVLRRHLSAKGSGSPGKESRKEEK